MSTEADVVLRTESLTALVLGGRGFLGRHVVAAMRANGISVTTATRGPASADDTISLNPAGDDLGRLCENLAAINPAVVVNCVGRIDGDPAELIQSNIVFPERLVHAVGAALPKTRVIHLGSAGEYGIPRAADRPIDEDADENPVSNYGLSKLAGTRTALAAAADHGVDLAVLRVFNPIGPGGPSSTLPGRTAQLLREAVAHDPHSAIEMAPLDAYRDFIDVRDVASAVVAAARVSALPHRLYNVGSGRAARVRDVVTHLAAEAGYQGRISEQQPPTERSAGVSWQQAAITRAASELGWVPTHDLASSARELWKWVG